MKEKYVREDAAKIEDREPTSRLAAVGGGVDCVALGEVDACHDW